MEDAVRKLITRKMALRRQRRQIDREEAAIDTALGVIGFDPKRQAMRDGFMEQAQLEDKYEESRVFKDMTLADACLQIVNDYRPRAVDKNDVEYCLTIGGYPFTTDDPTNSTEITLRKLAADGKCEVEKGKGSTPSRYHSLRGAAHVVEDSRATKM
ncbi:MAG: hypothetical protein JST11_17055 [Acidobacteria bacterium]|nr:hypothetical protein [Acidobacteriota bacterium]